MMTFSCTVPCLNNTRYHWANIDYFDSCKNNIRVYCEGVFWPASSISDISDLEIGEPVLIVGRRGLTLLFERKYRS